MTYSGRTPTPEEVDRATRVMDRALASPFLSDYQQALRRGSSNVFLNIREALGEQAGIAALLVQDYESVTVHLKDGTDETHARIQLGEAVINAHHFYWRSELIKESQFIDIPPHIIGNKLLPYDSMYVTSDGAIGLSIDGSTKIDAMYWHESPTGVSVWGYGSREGQLSWAGFFIKHGARFPEEVPSVVAAPVLKMVAFLNSPYTETIRERLPRSSRRQLQRAELPEPEMNIVRLRARVPSQNESADGHTERRVDGHWWVRGHIRAQWYPSEQAHKLIWIREHIKGNPEAPLKGHAYAVVH